MNVLHPNDKQNISKHRKMIRRKAEHPREGLPLKTTSFRPTGRYFARHDSITDDIRVTAELKEFSVTRNNAWIAA